MKRAGVAPILIRLLQTFPADEAPTFGADELTEGKEKFVSSYGDNLDRDGESGVSNQSQPSVGCMEGGGGGQRLKR